MSNPSTPVREDDVRDTEGLSPSESESSFGDILSQFEQSHAHEASRDKGVAATVAAVVVAVTGDSVFFDVGQKTEGVLPLALLVDDQGPIPVKAGDTVQVSVGSRNSEGYFQLSLIRVERPKDWSNLQKAFDEKLTIAGVVTQVIKGGLAVDVGVRAFMPASRSGARDVPEMQTMVGQEIACRVIKLDTEKEDVVVDRRAVMEEERARAREELLAHLQVGVVVSGTVRSLLDYGAFVDIGGIDGMLHVADISHGRVNKPADVLTIGQQLDVKILKVDPVRQRVSLGLSSSSRTRGALPRKSMWSAPA
jgi:small subunit ribosomal protein S1